MKRSDYFWSGRYFYMFSEDGDDDDEKKET
jgi:hypothetical protein